MGKPLFEIQENWAKLLMEVEECDGEIDEDLDKRLQITKDELQLKGIGYAYILQELEAYSDRLADKIKQLTAMKKATDKKYDLFKGKISGAMIQFEVDEIKGDFVRLSFRKSTVVNIDENAAVPEEFKEYKASVKLKDLEKALKEGREFDGIGLLEKKNLQIK